MLLRKTVERFFSLEKCFLICFLILAANIAPSYSRNRGRGKVANFDQAESRNISHGKPNERREKLFSLFNVVTFDNQGCTSTDTFTGAASGGMFRNGTCFTAQECSDMGGTANGGCAVGFGVCCVFIVSASGSSINENCTYIQNPGFPAAFTEVSAVTYTINKVDNDVCFIRLDLETFTILGPADSLETMGGICASDTFNIMTNTNQLIPQTCGMNTGQHMYIEIGAMDSDTITLNFAFMGASTVRQWDIKATQVECTSMLRPPTGCLQYHAGLTGRFQTFNFLSTTTSHLALQEYSICVRREAGFCCVNYQVCQGIPAIEVFTLDGTEAAAAAVVETDSQCTLDFITIATSNAICSTFGPQINRYCGARLGTNAGNMENTPICDCTAPFTVDIRTDNLQDAGAGGGNPQTLARGVCLEYVQVPCGTI